MFFTLKLMDMVDLFWSFFLVYDHWGNTDLDSTVKLGYKERFDKEQIGVKEPFPVTNSQFTL